MLKTLLISRMNVKGKAPRKGGKIFRKTIKDHYRQRKYKKHP